MMDIRVEIHETHPSGAKAQLCFVRTPARLKSCPFKADRFSAGAKAHVYFAAVAARLKSCPFKAESFSAGAKAHVEFAAVSARLKSCPDTNQRSSAACLALPAGWMPSQFPFFAAPYGAFPPQVSQAKTMKRGLYV
jgi:hypothetical protein